MVFSWQNGHKWKFPFSLNPSKESRNKEKISSDKIKGTPNNSLGRIYRTSFPANSANTNPT
ncbi:MAG: hypothetical protein A3H02_02555 [Candidatus Niyogibacteria bacterium RIFCSPLOWO2_12_FULL_41_13]|uniref:Uncharacterized protein n=1 Tax=Candidatus Niyogibacteria bacterium RIFCSPLOWO2_12_FULL_41_13 TaxID=1801726 RepID=A0A1G2F0J1_9BACT|nr:MAG: hypothetical protein A3H02_02555 [Candidatus Niyogibacteria bacterium RIFCSPLOWO2_12_FULL_41_13]